MKDHDPDLAFVKTNEPDGQINIDDANFVDTSHTRGDVTGASSHAASDSPKDIVASLHSDRKSVNVEGSLHSRTTFHEVVPYSELYGAHPSTIMSTTSGLKFVSTRSDPFTAKGGEVMKARHMQHSKSKDVNFINKYRTFVIENQNLAFTSALTHLLTTAVGPSPSVTQSAFNDSDQSDVPMFIQRLYQKNDRKDAFDAISTLTTSAFSISACPRGRVSQAPENNSVHVRALS